MYSSHPAKEKLFTRTQREAHSLQFEKIYTGMYSSHPAKEKFTTHQQTSQPWSTENWELEAQKSGDFSKNLEIDYYLYFGGLRKKKWLFFGVEHDKNTIWVSISSKSTILICTKMSRGCDSECERLVASDNLIWHQFSKYGFLGLSPLADLDLFVLCGWICFREWLDSWTTINFWA